ncbi:MAG: CAP domain-containing protein, partial [Patescibacteria group bacterium]
MKRILKKYVIAHSGNDGKPHLLRAKGVAITAMAIVFLFLLSLGFKEVLLIRGDFNFAAIVSAVLVDLANIDRQQNNNLPSLRINPVLVLAAQLKANDMAQKGYFAHTSPEGVDPWFWFKKAGYKYSNAGENLAIHFSDSQDVNNAWMNSPKHRENILNGKFQEVGIALAQGTFQGQVTTYVVQLFGTPLSAPAPAPAGVPIASTVNSVNREETEVPAESEVKGETTPAPAPEVTEGNGRMTITEGNGRMTITEGNGRMT